MDIQLKQAEGRKRAPVTRVGKNADTAPDLYRSALASQGEDSPSTMKGLQSTHSRALDRDFFDSQAMAARPFVKGGSRDGMGYVRAKSYPHQNSIADDGTNVAPGKARVTAVLEAAGAQTVSGKKHFKIKRAKQRSGRGYD